MTKDGKGIALANPVARCLEAPVRAIQVVMGWGLIGLCLATAYEIVMRRIFGLSLQGVDEIGGYVLAVSSTWGFSIALLQRAHSRVDFLYSSFPPMMRSVVNLVAAACLAGVSVFASWQGWTVLAETLRWQARANTPLQTPLWIPQGLWFGGLVIFATVSVTLAVHAMILMFKDRRALDRYYGPPSIKEQIEIETQGNMPTAIGDAK